MSLFGVINATNITVNANISSNTTWSVDTVYIDADIAIDSGFVLTINPGTVILFNDFYQIQVYGLIISFGTELDPIIYTVEDTTGFSTFSHTGWNGFLFDNSANDCQQDTSVFVYSEFYYAIETLEWYGGATFIIKNFSKIVFDHCTFMYNYSTQMGGALGIQDNSSPIIVNSVFEYNFSDYGGGAVNFGCDSAGDTLCPYFENNIFRYNQCLYTGTYYGGGAIKISAHSQAIFINNIITDNSCPIGTGGGGIVISGYSSPILINNLIANNYASATGGGIMIRYNANPVLINNTIVNNSADGDGGGIGNGCSTDSLRMYNNIVYGNTAAGAGNQVFINNDDDCIEYEFANNLFEGGTLVLEIRLFLHHFI
jgi:parallel beta-helix repeat protein